MLYALVNADLLVRRKIFHTMRFSSPFVAVLGVLCALLPASALPFLSGDTTGAERPELHMRPHAASPPGPNSDHPEPHALSSRRSHAASLPVVASINTHSDHQEPHSLSGRRTHAAPPSGRKAKRDQGLRAVESTEMLPDKSAARSTKEVALDVVAPMPQPDHPTHDKGPEVLLQRSAHHRRHAFRQPKSLEGEPALIWGLPKLMWVILADIVAVFLFMSCIPLIMFLSKRRRPNFDEKEGCLPSCLEGPQPVDRMGV